MSTDSPAALVKQAQTIINRLDAAHAEYEASTGYDTVLLGGTVAAYHQEHSKVNSIKQSVEMIAAKLTTTLSDSSLDQYRKTYNKLYEHARHGFFGTPNQVDGKSFTDADAGEWVEKVCKGWSFGILYEVAFSDEVDRGGKTVSEWLKALPKTAPTKHKKWTKAAVAERLGIATAKVAEEAAKAEAEKVTETPQEAPAAAADNTQASKTTEPVDLDKESQAKYDKQHGVDTAAADAKWDEEKEPTQAEKNEALMEGLNIEGKGEPVVDIDAIVKSIADYSEALRSQLEKLAKGNVHDSRLGVAADILHNLADEVAKFDAVAEAA